MSDDSREEKKINEMMDGTIGAPKPPADWIHPGSHLGTRYEILEILGEGGMGKVYHAYDHDLDRHVALKLIRESISSEAVVLERFKREIQLASKITHRNILRIHDMGDIDGTKYVSMNYIKGLDLHKLIKREGSLSIERSIGILQQLCHGLKAAHDEGVLHRDLKPQNIMLDEKDSAYITDFGLARSLETESGEALTATGMVPGTPMYMSPEQIKGESLDQRSDIYSLGLILYEMLTGKFPFPAPSNYASLVRRTQQKPESPAKINPGIPRYLAAIVMKCLENDPELRYHDTSQILDDLTAKEVHTTTMLRVRSTIRRRWRAALLATFIAALGAFILIQRHTLVEKTGQVASLAILPFVSAGEESGSDWIGIALQDLLINELRDSESLRVVSGRRLLQTLREMSISLPFQGLAAAQWKQMADSSTANILLTGKFTKDDNSLHLDVLLADFREDPESIHQFTTTGSMQEVLEKLAHQVWKRTKTKEKPATKGSGTVFTLVSGRSQESLKSYFDAVHLIREENYSEAIGILGPALKEDPAFPLAQAKLAEAYYSNGEKEAAEKAAKLALQSTGSLPDADIYYLRAIVADLAGDGQKAVAVWKELQARYPHDPDSYAALGKFYSDREDWIPSMANYRNALELDGKNSKYLIALGRVELKNGNAQSALSYLTDAQTRSRQLGSDNERASLLNMMGFAYRQLEYYESALEHYQRALQIKKRMNDSSGMALILGNISLVYSDLGRYEDARQGYLEALSIAEDLGDETQWARMLNDLGFLAEKAGRFDEALEYYNRALQAARADQAVEQITNRLNNIGWIYYLTGRFTDAATYYELAFKEIGDSNPPILAHVLETYGTLLADQGEYRKAVDFYSRGRSIRKETQDKAGEVLFLSDLARIRILVGAHAEAKKDLDEALHLSYEISDKTILTFFYLVQAEFFRVTGQTSQAQETLKKAEGFAEQSKDRYMILLVRAEKGTLLNEMNRPEESIPLLEELVQKTSELNLHAILPIASRELAQAYHLRNRSEDAMTALRTGMAIAERLNMPEDVLSAHFLAAKILSAQNQTEQAMRHYREALRAAERIRKETRDAYSGAFLKRKDVQRLLKEAGDAFRSAGKEKEFKTFAHWLSETT